MLGSLSGFYADESRRREFPRRAQRGGRRAEQGFGIGLGSGFLLLASTLERAILDAADRGGSSLWRDSLKPIAGHEEAAQKWAAFLRFPPKRVRPIGSRSNRRIPENSS
jgi:hypothetical protein